MGGAILSNSMLSCNSFLKMLIKSFLTCSHCLISVRAVHLLQLCGSIPVSRSSQYFLSYPRSAVIPPHTSFWSLSTLSIPQSALIDILQISSCSGLTIRLTFLLLQALRSQGMQAASLSKNYIKPLLDLRALLRLGISHSL